MRLKKARVYAAFRVLQSPNCYQKERRVVQPKIVEHAHQRKEYHYEHGEKGVISIRKIYIVWKQHIRLSKTVEFLFGWNETII